jgi:hypothetical protein
MLWRCQKTDTAKHLCENEPFFTKPYNYDLILAQIRQSLPQAPSGSEP